MLLQGIYKEDRAGRSINYSAYERYVCDLVSDIDVLGLRFPSSEQQKQKGYSRRC
jgi:hypothetical protein